MSARSMFARPDRRWVLALVAGLIAMLAAPAAWACEVTLGPVQTDTIAYDPFVLGSVDGSIRTSVELASGDACTLRIGLTDDAGQPARLLRVQAGGVTLALQPRLRESAAVRADTTPDTASVTLSPDQPRATIEWRLTVAEDAVIPPGDYAIPLIVTASMDGAAPPPNRGTLVLTSLARAQANLAGVAGRFEDGSNAQVIDLGELVTGKRKAAYLQVRANTPARLTFTSQNAGYLVNNADGVSRIDYQLAVAGDPVNLRAASVKAVTAPLTINGIALELLVTVGSTKGATAGRYSDTVSIEISP